MFHFPLWANSDDFNDVPLLEHEENVKEHLISKYSCPELASTDKSIVSDDVFLSNEGYLLQIEFKNCRPGDLSVYKLIDMLCKDYAHDWQSQTSDSRAYQEISSVNDAHCAIL